MKNTIITLITSLLVFSCTEIVNVPLDTSTPKLVVEAIILWKKGTDGKQQAIKLSTTTNFYTNTIPTVSGAVVTVKNSDNMIFNFIETPNTGIYTCSNFIPVLGETYKLTIVSNGKTYTATETLKPVAEITDITQELGGLSGETIQIKANFLDPKATDDFYLLNYKYPNKIKPDFFVFNDKFFNGNPYFSITFNDELKKDDKITITHFGISKQYFEYLNVLLTLAGNDGGGPFQAPPVTVRGNVINTTNPEDFPLGYFSLSEIDSKEYTVK